jgi:D-alanyl-D-alanine carboxypeptidase
MWKLNSSSLKAFTTALKHLTLERQLGASALLLLFFLYPGHNSLQTLTLSLGEVRAYTLNSPRPVLYPKHIGLPAPRLSARAVVVQDVGSKTLIYSKNPDALLLPASITKVMTALVALDHWQDLDTVIEVKNEDRAIGQTIDLERGERITLRNILYGLIVHSGNDAALAVADNYPGGYSEFVKAMNEKAKNLHLEHTTFKNPSGVEQYGHVTTARDLAILAGVAMQNPLLAEMAQTKRIVVTDVSGTIVHDLETTNELLGEVEGLKGLKTGWTENAGECLVSYVDRDGHQIIVVVLGSADRFGDTRQFVDWTYANHEWVIPAI